MAHIVLNLAAKFIILMLLLFFAVCIKAIDIPGCSFEDTVDLTDSTKFENNSYLFDGVIIPPELVGTYNYEIFTAGVEELVDEHIRGCVCKLKPCIKFCCHPSELKPNASGQCINKDQNLSYSPYMNVSLGNGNYENMNVEDDFVIQTGIPCAGYPLVPQKIDGHQWELFENGTVFRIHGRAHLSRLHYCLIPTNVDGTYFLNPYVCSNKQKLTIKQILNSIAMAISIPLLILTAFVYWFVPKLRNLHGKCLICYLLFLAMGYTSVVVIPLFNVPLTDLQCSILGFSGYFSFMCAFFWLSIISFDLWNTFRGTKGNVNRFMQKDRFCAYSLYACTIPAILTALTIMAQLSDIDEALKPGIGEVYCWLKTKDWSAMLYFYGPILIIMLLNTAMFISTSANIYMVKMDVDRGLTREESARHLRSQNDNYGLFLRLFIMMGVTWILEVLSYIVGEQESILFYIIDLCNAAQGIIIFVLFVMKRKVKLLIKERIKSSFRSNATNSDCSPEEVSLQDCTRVEALQSVD